MIVNPGSKTDKVTYVQYPNGATKVDSIIKPNPPVLV